MKSQKRYKAFTLFEILISIIIIGIIISSFPAVFNTTLNIYKSLSEEKAFIDETLLIDENLEVSDEFAYTEYLTDKKTYNNNILNVTFENSTTKTNIKFITVTHPFEEKNITCKYINFEVNKSKFLSLKDIK